MTSYKLIRSTRKTLSLQVNREGEIIVRAPNRLSLREIDRFVQSHSDWLQKAVNRQNAWRERHPEPDEVRAAELRKLAETVLPGKVERYAQLMGLHPSSVKITAARSRFGSCSSRNSLCFSWRLMAYPEDAIDYVVVHELAHIVHKNHSAAFWQCVASVFPDYRERRALLRC